MVEHALYFFKKHILEFNGAMFSVVDNVPLDNETLVVTS
jgi:hypothetical protein